MKRTTLTPEQADWLNATFARNRDTFGGWQMMADDADDSGSGDVGAGDGGDQGSGNGDQAGGDAGDAGEAALGDAGKQALDRMKAERREAREAAAAEKARADALQAKLDGKEAEHAAAQERAATEAAALAKANDRIRRSEVKAAAKGVLADPKDAYKFLDLDRFEVSDDGEVDEDAIKAALEDLVSKKPYLAVQDGRRFQGDADGGARKESSASIDQQIADAEKAGDHARVISLKRAKAHANH